MERFDNQEIKVVEEVIRSGKLSRFFQNFRGGDHVRAFEEEFADYIGVKHAVSVCNGTTSLEIILQAMGIGKGDEVITTPLTFIATGTAILKVQATPIFVDINPRTLNISPKTIEQAISSKTKAIMPVDLLGMPCDIDGMRELIGRKNILVLQDAAQALGAIYGGVRVGALADAASFSLQETKTITSAGEGGMIVTNDDSLAEKCLNLRNHGNCYGDEVDLICGNARMTETQAAFGRIQLKKVEQLTQIQQRNACYFLENLPEGLFPIYYRRFYSTKGYSHLIPSFYLIPTVLSKDVNISRDDFVKKMSEIGISRGLPGQNVGFYRKLICDYPIFYSYETFGLTRKKWPVPAAREAVENVILWDIHRFNHTVDDMKRYLKEIKDVLQLCAK